MLRNQRCHSALDETLTFLVKEGATKQGIVVDLGAIYCQKYIQILDQSDESQAGCLNAAKFSHLPGRTGLWRLFLFILPYIFLVLVIEKNF